jgi:hypothetical protein
MLDPTQIVTLETVTSAVNVGMYGIPDDTNTESWDLGTPKSQFVPVIQSVLVAPTHVVKTPVPPKSQFLFVASDAPSELFAVIRLPCRASDPPTSTQLTLGLPLAFNIHCVPL